jgi:hypothetical protein
MHALARPVIFASRDRPKSRVKPKDIKRAIDHAKLLCLNFEDTVECRLAWEKVEELSSAHHDQKYNEKKDGENKLNEERRQEAAKREYDV